MEQEISGQTEQPREVDKKFQNEFPETYCFIGFEPKFPVIFGRLERAIVKVFVIPAFVIFSRGAHCKLAEYNNRLIINSYHQESLVQATCL